MNIAQVKPTMSIIVNKWRMDSSLNALIHCETGETRRLGEYHFILLETLAKNADTVLSRSFLMTEVWKNRIVGGNSLPTAIHALRVAIDDDGKQQEIIKTIPKKGYVFNKSYLTITDGAVNEIREDSVADNNETPTESSGDEQVNAEPQPDIAVIKQPHPVTPQRNTIKKPRHNVMVIMLPIIIISLILFSLIYYIKTTPTPATVDAPLLIKEEAEHADRITIYHLYNEGTHEESSALVSLHLRPGMAKISPLLTTHNALMTLYYKVSLDKMVLDIVLSNQCNKSWQLVLNFKNWQNKDTEINTILFQEVEKMLNEIPKCE